MVGGMRRSRTASSTCCAAWPSEYPGLRLNETVTAGSCPKWLIESGPVWRRIFTTASSGTSGPCDERM